MLIDYATLTGACSEALGSRYSGALPIDPEWLPELISLGQQSGERVWPFPWTRDYDDNLESEWADLLQCALAPPGSYRCRPFSQPLRARADALAAPRSERFSQQGGNGVVGSEVTGFGVRLTLTLLDSPLGMAAPDA